MGAAFRPRAGPGWAGQNCNLMKSCYGRGEKNGYLAWPGLAEAGLSGEKKRIPEKLESIFSPRSVTSFLSPGRKNGFICRKWSSKESPNDIPRSSEYHQILGHIVVPWGHGILTTFPSTSEVHQMETFFLSRVKNTRLRKGRVVFTPIPPEMG